MTRFTISRLICKCYKLSVSSFYGKSSMRVIVGRKEEPKQRSETKFNHRKWKRKILVQTAEKIYENDNRKKWNQIRSERKRSNYKLRRNFHCTMFFTLVLRTQTMEYPITTSNNIATPLFNKFQNEMFDVLYKIIIPRVNQSISITYS